MSDLPENLASLLDQLDRKAWTRDPGDLEPHLSDWRGRYRGHSPILFQPSTTEEVSQILKACNQAGIGVVPQSGNTGLVGGSTPQGEVLLSLKRMNRIRRTDIENESVTVDAGVILQTLQEHAADHSRLFPLSLGAQGSAMLGGLISTNAGGVHVVKYGMMRDLVLGLEVVLPDGQILSDLAGLRKDNTGLDLKQLFIGAEGTLGVITAATLKLFARPADTCVALASVESPHKAVDLLRHMKETARGSVAAFELIPRAGLELVLEHIPGARTPLSEPASWTVLIELVTEEADKAAPAMENALGSAFEQALAFDGVIAQTEKQAADFWALRESIPEAEKHHGKAAKHDVSVPVSCMADFIVEATKLVESEVEDSLVIAFGHVGDGNVHFNISRKAPGADDTFIETVGPVTARVYDLVDRYEGSISAEHGIGTLKRSELGHRKPLQVALMRQIKSVLDPKGIMNPRILTGADET